MIKSIQRETQVLMKQQKIVESNLAFEPDIEIRDIMKQKHTKLKVQIQRLEEDKIAQIEQSCMRNEEIGKQLQILDRSKTILFSGDKSQKTELLDALGSNWQIKDKKLLYEPNYVCEAITKVRKSMPDKFSRFEPKETGTMSAQTMLDECVSFIWRRLWELIRNQKHFLKNDRGDI